MTLSISSLSRRWGSIVVAVLAIALTRVALAQPLDEAAIKTDLSTLAGSNSRSVGTPGYEAAMKYVEAEARKLPGVDVQIHTFDVMTPQTVSAQLTTPGANDTLYSMLPAGVRLNTTPSAGFEGELVYCGTGTFDEIPAKRLQGNIAVVEGNIGEDWRQVAYFGAKAIIFLGSDAVASARLRAMEIPIPVNVPRFYLPDGPTAAALRQSVIPRGTVSASANWVRSPARNIYVYISAKGALTPVETAGHDGRAFGAITVVAQVDATGMVPDFSPAAGQAVQPAVALGMLRDFATNPPKRPMLFAFTGADAFALSGSRQMLMALADPPRKWRDELADSAIPTLTSVEQDLAVARDISADLSRLNIVAHRSLVTRLSKLIETDVTLLQDQLFRLRVLPKDQVTDEVKTQTAALEAEQASKNKIKYAFTTEPERLKELADDAQIYLARVIERLGGKPGTEGLLQQYTQRKDELQRRVDLFAWLNERLNAGVTDPDKRLPINPGMRDTDGRQLELAVSFDLSDAGVRVGPALWGRYYQQTSVTPVQEYKEWFTAQAAQSWFKPLQSVVDFSPLSLTRTPQSYLAAPVAFPTEACLSWGIPAMGLATLDDLRVRRDTPNDTIANLRLAWVMPQAQAVATILRRAVDDPAFLGSAVGYRRSTNGFVGQAVSTASGRPVPDLARENFLANIIACSANRKIPGVRSQGYAMGVRRIDVAGTNAEGRYLYEGLPRVGGWNEWVIKVYRPNPNTGEITASSDLGKQAMGLVNVVNLDQPIVPVKSVVFDCEEFSLFGLYDPRFLQSLGEVQLMDARRNAEPQRFDAVLFNQMMAAQIEPGTRAYLLFRYGRIGNRILMLNVPSAEQSINRTATRGEGDGYTAQQLNDLGPLALATARDFFRLNAKRIAAYAKAGVTSSLIDTMHANAARKIIEADAALEKDQTVTMMRNAAGAWADEARVYDAVQKMANDVIYAAIFLLLLAVPFSFCMERLVIGTPSVYKQIAGAAAVFGIMTGALWLFHPAFKLSSSPLIIVLAFAIIFMSIVVIGVVYGRFDSELKRIRSGRGTAQGTSFASSSVLMSAIMLGIANMRRRRFRTALTAITVVLITFAVLCFTSTSRYQGTVSLPTGEDSEYSGLMLRQRGFRSMPNDALASLKAAYPQYKFVARYWTLDATNQQAQTQITAGGLPIDGQAPRVVAVQALLGLSPGESELSQIGDIVPGFERLEKGEADIAYLPITIAERLKVSKGDRIELGGRSVEVAGVFDASAFDQRVSLLSREPIAPLNYAAGALDASGKRLSDSNDDTLSLDADSAGAEAGATYGHLPSTQFVITTDRVARLFDLTSLRTVGVKIADVSMPAQQRDEALQLFVDDVTKRFALATFAGYSDGVKLVSASNLSSIGGGANVVIPLAIGGLIIFNTMMGSIAERRREIHVYTSLGLAPVHVGALFVAEALTYGLIGSVFGYIIGQGVGTLLLKLGWLGNVTLNYSGSSAMLTLGLILLIVLLSALVPARLASKIAAPSIDRSWRVPAPKNNQIIATLPFTINQTAAQGVIAYLAEFFESHQEGSIGKFSAGNIEAFAGTNDGGKPTRGLKTVIWLTPFDLGVRQHLMLLIHPGEFNEIYEVQVVLERLSGDDRSWWRMNRTFLTEIRKQFLQWRSLAPARMKDYVVQSRQLFDKVPDEVVATDNTEEVRLG